MYLEDQIALITNPQEFTRLCNSIFTCIYSGDFQIIDGTRSDEGNDGYVRSEKRIFAIYCPIKPEKKTDSDYLEKIKNDMQKAASLRDTDKFEIERWTFITPRKLSSNLIAKMDKLGTDHGFVVNHLEATYLANELYKNPHLFEAFPQLHVPRIDAKLDEILNYIKQKEKEEPPPQGYPSSKPFVESKSGDTRDNKRVIELRHELPTGNIKKELRTIYYKTEDIIAQLNALIGLLDFYDPAADSSPDMIALCETGITLTESMGKQRFKAYFLAWKAYLLSFTYIMEDTETFFSIMASNLVGLPFVTEEQRQETLSRLRHLYEEYNSSFDAALDLTVRNNDPLMMAGVVLLIGNAAGQRGLAYRQMGLLDRAEREKLICKKSLLTAKNIYSGVNDEEGVVNAVFNLANQIRFFDEKDEALALARQSIESARRINNKLLLQKAIRLEETIRTGIIPDYIHGERRKPYDRDG
jgi:hypothetical protein